MKIPFRELGGSEAIEILSLASPLVDPEDLQPLADHIGAFSNWKAEGPNVSRRTPGLRLRQVCNAEGPRRDPNSGPTTATLKALAEVRPSGSRR